MNSPCSTTESARSRDKSGQRGTRLTSNLSKSSAINETRPGPPGNGRSPEGLDARCPLGVAKYTQKLPLRGRFPQSSVQSLARKVQFRVAAFRLPPRRRGELKLEL